MINRLFDKCLISPKAINPSQENLRVVGSFNPGAAKLEDTTYLLVRVAEMPREKKKGFYGLPRAENGKIVIDWYEQQKVTFQDERVVYLKNGNFLRLTNISHLRLAKSKDGINIDWIDEKPTLFPQEDYEELGMEDARITPIGDTFYITYVAISRDFEITTALISTRDFKSFERHGIIFTTLNKDVVIFPEKVKGKYVSFHRPLGACSLSSPKIWMAFSSNLVHWGEHHALAESSGWGSMKVGAGPPPIKTEKGWLAIYHGSHKANDEDTVGVYSAGAALFDLDDPRKLIGITREPILVPEMDYETLVTGSEYEKEGFLANILFPTGIVAEGDNLFLYSGAADTYTSVTKLSLREVLDAVKPWNWGHGIGVRS